MSLLYNGHLIDARAFELKDASGWRAEVCVAEEVGADTDDTRLVLPQVFPTRQSALGAALAFGKEQVDKRIESSDLKSVIEAETRLPSTHRHGFGHETDDVATDASGEATKVWGPDNPEDRHE